MNIHVLNFISIKCILKLGWRSFSTLKLLFTLANAIASTERLTFNHRDRFVSEKVIYFQAGNSEEKNETRTTAMIVTAQSSGHSLSIGITIYKEIGEDYFAS